MVPRWRPIGSCGTHWVEVAFPLRVWQGTCPCLGPLLLLFNDIQRILQYWTNFHDALRGKIQPLDSDADPVQLEDERIFGEPEGDDPAGTLELFVNEVDRLLVGAEAVFTDVKASLLEAIETPVTVSAT